MTLATKTTRRARITCTCPTCVTMGHEAPANGVFMCRGGEQIEFLGYHEGILIVVSDQKSAAQADLDEHRHEIARRALATATLTPDQADVITEELAPAADLDAEVEAACNEETERKIAYAEDRLTHWTNEMTRLEETGRFGSPVHMKAEQRAQLWLDRLNALRGAGDPEYPVAAWSIPASAKPAAQPQPDAPAVSGGVVDSEGTLFPVETPDPRNTPEYRRFTEPRREEFIPASPAELDEAPSNPAVGAACGGVVVDLDAVDGAYGVYSPERVVTQAHELAERIDAQLAQACEQDSPTTERLVHLYNRAHARAIRREMAANLPFTPDNSPIPTDHATAFLTGEERRAGVPEAQHHTPVSDLYSSRIADMGAQIDALFPTETEVNARDGRDEPWPLRDAWLDMGEAGLYLQSAAHHLRAALEPERPNVAEALRTIETVIKTMTTALDPIRNDIGNEVRAWEQLADKAA